MFSGIYKKTYNKKNYQANQRFELFILFRTFSFKARDCQTDLKYILFFDEYRYFPLTLLFRPDILSFTIFLIYVSGNRDISSGNSDIFLPSFSSDLCSIKIIIKTSRK